MPPCSGWSSPNKDSSYFIGNGIILGLIQEQDDIHLNSTAPQIVYVRSMVHMFTCTAQSVFTTLLNFYFVSRCTDNP